jgi:hypothetical protein
VAKRLFALDHNFPQPIVDVLSEFIAEADLVPIDKIDRRMPDLDDWELLLALHLDSRSWDGLITADSSMTARPKELSVLLQTKLTLVVAEAAGHDPLKATGLVLAHLPGICARTDPDVPQLWTLRTASKPHTDPWDRLSNIASRRGLQAKTLHQTNKLSAEELLKNPLDDRED